MIDRLLKSADDEKVAVKGILKGVYKALGIGGFFKKLWMFNWLK